VRDPGLRIDRDLRVDRRELHPVPPVIGLPMNADAEGDRNTGHGCGREVDDLTEEA